MKRQTYKIKILKRQLKNLKIYILKQKGCCYKKKLKYIYIKIRYGKKKI